MRTILLVASVAILTAISGCSKEQNKGEAEKGGAQPQAQAQPQAPTGEKGGGQAEAKPTAAIPEESKKIYDERCAACHGATGAGEGPASAALTPKPRNYHDKEWQKSVTDEQLRDIIVKGGAGVGKSPMMPPNPDLADKPEVVNGLVALIRSFGKD